MAKSDFCPICYKKGLENGTISPKQNINEIIFRCKVPLFDIDAIGNFVVKIWNCKEQRYKTISQSEYEKLKKEGKL